MTASKRRLDAFELPSVVFPRIGAAREVVHVSLEADLKPGTLKMREWKMQEWKMRE